MGWQTKMMQDIKKLDLAWKNFIFAFQFNEIKEQDGYQE
jgi:hypothetical protein